LRVIEWRGLGWAKTLIATLAVLDLVYFAVGLTRRRTRLWWTVYALHLSIVLIAGALSGSRSGILNVFALQALIYHYLRRPIRMRTALIFAAVLVLAGLVLGVAREGFKVEDGTVSVGLADAEQLLSSPTVNYGVTPLLLLVESGTRTLAFGSTLLSVVTNAVPRDWWPDKPDTGGVYFTKEYTADEWDGASNLTPTLLGELIINFGWTAGVALYLVVYPLAMAAVIRRYRQLVEQLHGGVDARTAIDFVIYLLWMWSVVALLTGELTNVLLNLALTGLVPAYVARSFSGPPATRAAPIRMQTA
jgi:hypothetical protein